MLEHLSAGDLHELEALPAFSGMRLPERIHLLDNEWRAIHVGDVAANAKKAFVVFVAATACEITACSFVSAADVVGDNTDYNDYTLYDGDPAAANAIGTVSTETTGGTDGSTAYVLDSLGTLSATHRILAAGEVVVFEIDATPAAGKAVVDMTVLLKVVPVDGGE